MDELLDKPIIKYMVKGFKAPHYGISDGCYKSLLKRGYWVSDRKENDDRRPNNLKCYLHESIETGLDNINKISFWYGHLSSNLYDYIGKQFNVLKMVIAKERNFQFVSEVIGVNNKLCLNLGCGWRLIRTNRDEKWINIDHRDVKGVDLDMIYDCMELPFNKDTISVISLTHVFEHLQYEKSLMALSYWFDLLKKDGELIIEVPDFDQEIKEYLDGYEERLINLYGRNRYDGDSHKWGWNIERLKRAIKSAGFVRSEEMFDYSNHSIEEPCIKIKAIK